MDFDQDKSLRDHLLSLVRGGGAHLAFDDFVADPANDLFAEIAHGDGQTILREALLVADHNAYHLGALAVMGRILKVER